MRIMPPLEHIYGHTAIESHFPEEYASLRKALSDVQVPLRPFAPFSREQRKLVPKRQKKGKAGKYKLLPVDHPQLNKDIETSLRKEGWETQPLATGPGVSEKKRKIGLKGDFVRNKVFVEVEFGNTASMYRDLFKFQIARMADSTSVAVLVLATDRFARMFDSGVATLETAKRLLPYMAIGIQMPVWICGIEPDDYGLIESRYGEMYQECASNGIACLTYEEATRTKPRYDGL